MEVRNVFHTRVGAGTLKCCTVFNHYERRNNNELVRSNFPRYNYKESWEYAVTCKITHQMKNNYAEK